MPSDGNTTPRMTAEQSMDRARETVHAVISEESGAASIVVKMATEVGAAIIEEIIPQGADLNSVELARRYAISRTPVREALMLLEKQGLVEMPPRRRPRVGVINLERAHEMFQVRALLMEALAGEVIASAGAADLDRLERATAGMQIALDRRDFRAFFWANTDFHIVNLAIARNHTVRHIVSSLLLRSMWLRRLTLEVPNRREESLDEHRRLVRAYRKGNVEMAGLLNRLIHLGAAQALRDSESTAKVSTDAR